MPPRNPYLPRRAAPSPNSGRFFWPALAAVAGMAVGGVAWHVRDRAPPARAAPAATGAPFIPHDPAWHAEREPQFLEPFAAEVIASLPAPPIPLPEPASPEAATAVARMTFPEPPLPLPPPPAPLRYLPAPDDPGDIARRHFRRPDPERDACRALTLRVTLGEPLTDAEAARMTAACNARP